MKKTVKKKPSSHSQDILVNKIVVRSSPHFTQDIANWKAAIRSFENPTSPNRLYLYNIYEDMLLDGQVEATWSKRQDAILNSRLVFVRDGAEDDDINRLLASADMRRLLADIHDTIAWGFTLVQINSIFYDHDQEVYRIDYDLIPRKHVHPERDFRSISIQEGAPARDFIFDQPPLSPSMLWAGSPADKGLFVKVAPYVIYKRGSYGDWAQFSEMFGMPFREMVYDDFDDATRRELESMLQDWGAAGYCIHPRSAELTIHDSGSSAASSDIYKTLVDTCDAAISKTILGNTLTTDSGINGARSLGEVHKQAEDDKFASDRDFVLSVLNGPFRAILKRFGINASQGSFAFQQDGIDWNESQARWNVLRDVYSTIPVDDDFLYESLSIPKPDNYKQMKAAMQQQPTFNPFENALQQHPNPPDKSSNQRLINRVKDFFA